MIMGLSGSGKSTLLRCINRLIRPTTGQVLVNGVDISKISEKELLQVRRKELAMVFQNFGLLPHRSVLSNIAFGLELQGVKKEEREKKAMESMKLVGLKGYEIRWWASFPVECNSVSDWPALWLIIPKYF